jgi:hypothetical protein
VMADSEYIANLLALASDSNWLLDVQHIAALRLLAYDGEKYPLDGSAITLSVMLQEVGIKVEDIFQVLAFVNTLETKRKWQRVPLGEQQPGDIGSTCGPMPRHGSDDVYLVLKVNNNDEMIIADNQQSKPHFRWVSGKGGTTPTKFFLRAPK